MINFTKDEVQAIFEELSHRPYREVSDLLRVLVLKIVQAEEAEQKQELQDKLLGEK